MSHFTAGASATFDKLIREDCQFQNQQTTVSSLHIVGLDAS